MDEAESIVQAYLSTPDGQSLGVLHLPFDGDETTSITVDYWRRNEIFQHHWNKIEFIQWMQTMIERGQIQSMETFQGGTTSPE
jgi:hypothetical protein